MFSLWGILVDSLDLIWRGGAAASLVPPAAGAAPEGGAAAAPPATATGTGRPGRPTAPAAVLPRDDFC
jgi:hypothetical protein